MLIAVLCGSGSANTVLGGEAFTAARPSHSLCPRVLVNLVITPLPFAKAAITVRSAAEHSLALPPEQEFGLLALPDLPGAVEFGIAFLLLDWSAY